MSEHVIIPRSDMRELIAAARAVGKAAIDAQDELDRHEGDIGRDLRDAVHYVYEQAEMLEDTVQAIDLKLLEPL